MTLVNTNSRKDLKYLAHAASALQSVTAGRQLGDDLSSVLKKLKNLNVQPATRSKLQTKLGMPKYPQNQRARSRRGRGKGGKLGMSVPRGLGGDQAMTVTQKDVIALGTGAGSAGAGTSVWGLGFATSSLSRDGLFNSTWMPRLAALAPSFRQFKLNWVQVDFVPYASSTVSGSVAIGFDPDPTQTYPTTLGQPLRHKVSCMSDLVAKCTLRYGPLMDGKKDPRFVAGAGRTDDELLYGSLEIYTVNSLPASTPYGYIVVTANVTFIGPA